MEYFLDIIFAVIIVICVFAGYKKGFVKSLTDLVSHIVAIIAARIISVQLAPQIFSQHFETGLKASLGEKIGEFGSGVSAQVQGTLDSIPNIAGFLSVAGVDKNAVADSVTQQIANEGVSVTEALMTNLVAPVATFIIRIVVFIAAFFVCIFLLKIITAILNKLAKLPLLKQVNKTFGLLFGAVKGIIFVAVICAALQLVAGVFNSESLSSIMSDSVIMSVFTTIAGTVQI